MFFDLTDEVERPVLVDVLVDLQDDADHVGMDRVQVQGQPRPVQVASYPVHLPGREGFLLPQVKYEDFCPN